MTGAGKLTFWRIGKALPAMTGPGAPAPVSAAAPDMTAEPSGAHRGVPPRDGVRRLRSAWRVITPTGRATLFVAVAAWLLGVRLGWTELFLIAACCVLALLIAVGFVIGRPSLDIVIELDPARVSVGTPAAGRLAAANRSRARLRAMDVEVPVGRGRATFHLPSLAGGTSHDELFVVPTDRRAVIPIGPPSAVRTDPLGLLRREAVEQVTVELFVHPKVIGLDSLSPGLQRDLEGQATRDLSTSDLAFHTLRDYATGDDWRHVHWRSTAKAGKLLVRQFQDTRRSQLAVVVDGAQASYRTEGEFELAMSVAGSVCVRAVKDQQDVCLVAASHAVTAASQHRILDTLARGALAETGQDLPTLAGRAYRLARDTTVLMLVTGSVIPFRTLKGAAVHFGPDVRVIALRCEPDAPPGLNRSGDLTVLALRELTDLPGLLNAGSVLHGVGDPFARRHRGADAAVRQLGPPRPGRGGRRGRADRADHDRHRRLPPGLRRSRLPGGRRGRGTARRAARPRGPAGPGAAARRGGRGHHRVPAARRSYRADRHGEPAGAPLGRGRGGVRLAAAADYRAAGRPDRGAARAAVPARPVQRCGRARARAAYRADRAACRAPGHRGRAVHPVRRGAADRRRAAGRRVRGRRARVGCRAPAARRRGADRRRQAASLAAGWRGGRGARGGRRRRHGARPAAPWRGRPPARGALRPAAVRRERVPEPARRVP